MDVSKDDDVRWQYICVGYHICVMDKTDGIEK